MLLFRWRILFLVVFLFLLNPLISQQIYFNNRYYLNQPGIWSAAFNAIESDDGYIISGTTGDSANPYWMVVSFLNLNDYGVKQRVIIITDPDTEYDVGGSGSLIRTIDDGLAFAGTSRYYGNTVVDKAMLWKLNANCQVLWQKGFGDIYQSVDTANYGRQVKQTFDTGYILVGEQTYSGRAISTMLLIRTDKDGNKLWEKTLGTVGINRGYSVVQTLDSGYAIGGFWYIPGNPINTGDPMVIKTDNQGNQQWIKNLGGGFKDNKAMICQDLDGNIIVGTNYADYMLGDEPYMRINIIKLDTSGNIIWNKKYGTSRYRNYLLNIRSMENGDIVATGAVGTLFPWRSGWIIKVDTQGDSLWYREYALVYADNSMNYLYDITTTSDEGFLACGTIYPSQPDTGSQDAWVIKLDSIGCPYPECDTTVGIVEIPYTGTEELVIYPNPATEWLQVTGSRLQDQNRKSTTGNRQSTMYLQIYDMYGRKVEEVIVPDGTDNVRIGVSDYRNGIYIAVLYSDSQIVGRKMFVITR